MSVKTKGKKEREGTRKSCDNLKCVTCEVACRALPQRADTTIPRYMKDKRRKFGSIRAVSLHRGYAPPRYAIHKTCPIAIIVCLVVLSLSTGVKIK